MKCSLSKAVLSVLITWFCFSSISCGGKNESSRCLDKDSDGYTDAACGGEDCDDLNPTVHPGAVEICDDGVDNNCDAKTDQEDAQCSKPDESPDGGSDQGSDAGADTGSDAGGDVGSDPGSDPAGDAGVDGGADTTDQSTCGQTNQTCCPDGTCASADAGCYQGLCVQVGMMCSQYFGSIATCIDANVLADCVDDSIEQCACVGAGNGWHDYCQGDCGTSGKACCLVSGSHRCNDGTVCYTKPGSCP